MQLREECLKVKNIMLHEYVANDLLNIHKLISNIFTIRFVLTL